MNRLKKTLVAIGIFLAILMLVGCETDYHESSSVVAKAMTYGNGYFTVFKSWGGPTARLSLIVYANDTGVMYYVNNDGITPLYNSDGSLQIAPGFEDVGSKP